MKNCARPLQTSDLKVDFQETLPCDMSPVMKEWKDNPPVEAPIEDEKPRYFSKKVLGSDTKILGDAASSSSTDGVKAVPEQIGEIEVVEGLNPPVEDGDAKIDEATRDNGSKIRDEQQTTGDEDMFFAQGMVTRRAQYEHRDALEAEKANKGNVENEEEGKPQNKKEKERAIKTKKKHAKAKATAKAKAKAKAKKEAARAKKELAKQKAKEKAAEKKEAKRKAALEKSEEKDKPKAKPKAKASAKVSAKRTRKAKGKSESDEPKDTPADAAPEVEEHSEEVPAGHADAPMRDAANDAASAMADAGVDVVEKKSFARRFRPSKHDPALRFDAIRVVFKKELEHRLRSQVGFWGISI